MKRLVAIALAAALGGAVGAASITAASAVMVPLEADFGVLMPGESASASVDLSVPVASVVAQAEWTGITGPGAWGARLCSQTACTLLDKLVGASVPAGSYRVVIDVTVPENVSSAATSARGHITLMESLELPLTDGLALTGSALPWIAMLAGAAALGGGTAVLLRRRRREETAA